MTEQKTTTNRKPKTVAFNGTGIPWFPTPCFLVVEDDGASDLLSALKLTELRLYLAILCEAGKDKSVFAEVKNKRAMELTGLDRWSLRDTRDALVKKHLITAVPQGKSAFVYTITDRSGAELKTRGAWRPGDADEDGSDLSWAAADNLPRRRRKAADDEELTFRPATP